MDNNQEKVVEVRYPNMEAVISINSLLQYAQIIPSIGKILFVPSEEVKQDQIDIAKVKLVDYLKKIEDLTQLVLNDVNNNNY